MSETSVKLPNATREKLANIAGKLGTLNTGAVGDVFWLALGDASEDSYSWSQMEIGVTKDGKLVTCYQSGCSCNGPEEPTVDDEYPLDDEIVFSSNYYDEDLNLALADLAPTVDTLHKVLIGGEVEPKEVLGLPNSEVRRAVVELVGYDRIVAEAKTLDESADGKLLEIPLPNDENIVVVHVKDPSTDREYFLRVPPDTKTAREARAWTFGFSADDFVLAKET